MKREYAGIPLWGWVAAAVAVAGVAFYIYRKNAASGGSGSPSGGTAADGTPYSSGVSALYGWLLDQQSSPAPVTTPAPNPDPDPDKHKKHKHKKT